MRPEQATSSLSFLLVFLALISGLPAQGQLGGVVHWQPSGPGHECVPPSVRQAVFSTLLQVPQDPADGVINDKFAFYPQAGTLGGDLYIGSYVDLDPGPGLLDWNCGGYTAPGHLGCDSEIRTFGEQVLGVPVFAVLDGVVVAAQDGFPDMNTTFTGTAGNYVVLSGPGGRLTSYWHLRMGSVAVTVGQSVKAGQQVGETASSGNSVAPHLHFEVQDGSTIVEPWSGPCRAGESEWIQQPAWNGALYAGDFAISRTSPGLSQYPFSPPRDGQWVQSDPWLYFWILAHNIPANSNYRVRFLRPNGTLAQDNGPYPLFNGNWQWAWWWWSWDVPEMRVLPGTWTMIFDLNGQTMVTAPIEVSPTATPNFNRPPEPITVSLEPSEPTAADVLIARVGHDLILDDLDYDIVRYQYVWRVNGAVVRSRVSAGRADMIPHHVAQGGDLVSCEVTPMDDLASGSPVTAGATVRALHADETSLSMAAGGISAFTIDVGPSFAASPYVFAASLAGTAPGIPIVPGVTVPLVQDDLTNWMLLFPNTFPYGNTLGQLDTSGRASPYLTIPPGFPPGFANLSLHHAALVVGSSFRATNSVTIVTLP
jgi:hypothetical protein